MHAGRPADRRRRRRLPGKVKVKVGPVISEFAGTARFVEKDDAAYRAVIDAKGRDARGAGNASALVTAHCGRTATGRWSPWTPT